MDVISIRDYLTSKSKECPVLSITEIPGYGKLYIVEHSQVGELSILIDNNMMLFFPKDWQGKQPKTVEEIAETDWTDNMGRDVVMMDGLPRIMA